MTRRVGLAIVVAVSLASVPTAAQAAWQANSVGSSSTRGLVMPAGSSPSGTVSGSDVTLTWTASVFANAVPVAGYTVARYAAGGTTPQSVGGTCAGTVAALTCKDGPVPNGRWEYTITPAQGAWRGAESAQGPAVSVGTASLALSSSTVASLPSVLTGTLSGFSTGEHVTFRLDDPSTGPLLAGSIVPDPVPSTGSTAASFTIPAGTGEGSHVVYAVGDLGATAGAGLTVDTLAPTVTSAAISKTAGGTPGFLAQAGTYYVYANLSDPSGVASATANVSTITTGQTAVTLTAGSYSAGGATYGWRSAALTATTPLSAGAKAFSITGRDVLGHAGVQGGFSVTIDNTVPAASDIQTANASGGTIGKAEAGDTITFTFTEPVEPSTILAAWTGSATAVTVRLNQQNGNGGDRLQVWNGTNSVQLPFGLIRVFRSDYVTADVLFTSSTMTMVGSTVVVTLGAPGGATSTAAGTGDVTWAPTASITDRAGNACSTAAATEGGAADAEF